MNRRQSRGAWIVRSLAISPGIRRGLLLLGAVTWIALVIAFARVAVRVVTGGAA